MKIRLPKDYRQNFTLEDMENVNTVREGMKEDACTAKEYLEMLTRYILKDETDYVVEAITVEAEFQKNRRAWNEYSLEGQSGDMDIWISGVLRTSRGFMEAGGYLTDIWHGADDIKEHTFSKRYIPA